MLLYAVIGFGLGIVVAFSFVGLVCLLIVAKD